MQKLLEDHLKLLRMEVNDDLAKSKAALIPIAIGGGLLVAAVLLSLTMLIGWLAWLVPGIPWFGWSGIIAMVLAVTGIIMFMVGKARLAVVNPLPEATLQTVKESIQCISDQVHTD